MHDVTRIAALLADIDGTLVTKEKVLTDRAVRAVDALRERGIVFTVTSGRPPFGMRMFVEPLRLTMPMAAFNGGAIVLPDLSVLDERLLPEYLVPALLDLISEHGLDVFVFRSRDWFVRSLTTPRVSRETATLRQAPNVVRSFDEVKGNIVKIVGVSEDPVRLAACEAAVRQAFPTQISAARSSAQYLDITHPTANKGTVIERLSRYLKLPLERIAAIGDQPNDVPMFERAGLSIAMGNASPEVQRRATVVTTSFADDGFAHAVERFILPHGAPPGHPAVRPTGRLHHLGQSLWLDGYGRDSLEKRTLERAIDELSVTGLATSSAVWARAVETSSAYDAAIAEGPRRGRTSEQVLYEIAIDDLSEASDSFRPIYERSAGVDGWVSLEASPNLANDAATTLAGAKALFSRIDRPNLMLAIPGTTAGLSAVEDLIFAGVPVNVGLLFSREHYLAAAEAYLRGIERRVDAGLRPDVASLASISIAPWDAATADRVPEELRGRLGIAVAQRTYEAYRDVLRSPRWQRIYNLGGRPQRLLWQIKGLPGSSASELAYASALTAQFTILAMGPDSLDELAAHGEVSTLLRADGGDSDEVIAKFRTAGVNLYALAVQLQEEGLNALVGSWNALIRAIDTKAARLTRPHTLQSRGPR